MESLAVKEPEVKIPVADLRLQDIMGSNGRALSARNVMQMSILNQIILEMRRIRQENEKLKEELEKANQEIARQAEKLRNVTYQPGNYQSTLYQVDKFRSIPVQTEEFRNIQQQNRRTID